MSKITVDEQKDLISDDDVYRIFLKRDDISQLSRGEQELRWQEHKKHLDEFRKALSKADAIVIDL